MMEKLKDYFLMVSNNDEAFADEMLSSMINHIKKETPKMGTHLVHFYGSDVVCAAKKTGTEGCNLFASLLFVLIYLKDGICWYITFIWRIYKFFIRSIYFFYFCNFNNRHITMIISISYFTCYFNPGSIFKLFCFIIFTKKQ